MSMTREEAIAILEQANEQLYHHQKDTSNVLAVHVLRERRTALSILAPSPRKEPPTVDEVGDEEDCWWFYERRCYIRAKGSEIREDWEEGEQWLPLSALPKGDV